MFRKSVVVFACAAMVSLPALAREVMPQGAPSQASVAAQPELQATAEPDQGATGIGLFEAMFGRGGTWLFEPSQGTGN